MSVNVQKNDENIIINIDKISLVSAISLQNNLYQVAEVQIIKSDKIEMYQEDDIVLSESFEEYKKYGEELIFFSQTNPELKDYLLPVAALVSVKISFQKNKTQKIIHLISALEVHEIRNILWNIKKAFETQNISWNFSENPLINQVKLRKFISENYSNEYDEEQAGLFQWIEANEQVSVIFEWDFDNQIVTSLLFKNLSSEWLSVDESIDIVENMDNSDKDVLFRLSLWERKSGDILPYEFWHASLNFELTLDFFHYTKLKNTFPYFWVLQNSFPILGYDYPEFLEKKEYQNIQAKFDELLTQITLFSQKIAFSEKNILFYLWANAHLVRTTVELNPIELVEFFEYKFEEKVLKDIQAELYKEFKKLSPIFARYIKL